MRAPEGGRRPHRASMARVQVMAPHLTAFAARVDELWAARRIWPGERCVLCDMAMLAAAKAGDPTLQGQVRCCSCTCHLGLMQVLSGL